MEIKKGTKWTCIEDVIIGYNLRIFNASENYESPSDNHLIDNSGKVRYVSSAWYDNFVATPAGRKTEDKIPQVENRGTTSPNIDKESSEIAFAIPQNSGNSFFIAGNLKLKKKDLQKGLGKVVEAMSNEEVITLWDEIFAVDETQYPMLNKMLHKEVERALALEALNTPIEKQSKESDAKEWRKFCEEYDKKTEIKNDSGKGYKEDSEKLNYELDFEFIEAMAQRMSANKHKYTPYNWQQPVDVEKLKQALFRHVIEVMKGNYEDDSRPFGHLESVSLNSMMLCYQLKNYKNAKIN